MELEAKLDEDFIFYLNFSNTFLRRIQDKDVQQKSKVWLNKLVGDPCEGIQNKRCRNIYLSHLLVNMLNNMLEGPFSRNPAEVNIRDATEIFGPKPVSIEPPSWLNDTDFVTSAHPSNKRGRTYVATRTLPDGQGAFAYIGISLTSKEPMWLGAAGNSFDNQIEKKYTEMFPPENELEKILARRKDPKEREKVLSFYDVLLRCIADELDGKQVADNDTVEGLLLQLIHDLSNKGMYEPYEAMEETDRRIELLLLLFDRVKIRRDKVATRQEILDDIEQKIMPTSFFDVTEVLPEDKYIFPPAMWEHAINRIPTKDQINRLVKKYPFDVIKKFLECLSAYKEEVAMRMQRRHENIATQMKKEMRKEGTKKKKLADEAQVAYENAMDVLEDVKEHYTKKMDAEKNREEAELSEHTKFHDNMGTATSQMTTYTINEKYRGRQLAEQINAVGAQTEHFRLVNEDITKKTEEASMHIRRNIKHLSMAIKRYQSLLEEMKSSVREQRRTSAEF